MNNNIHFAINNLDPNDKFGKVRPLIEQIFNCLRNFKLDQVLKARYHILGIVDPKNTSTVSQYNVASKHGILDSTWNNNLKANHYYLGT